MSVPGYSAWSVTAGEQPTTAYWNILGSNDAAFNTFLSNQNITAALLALSSGFAGGVISYTNAANGGGTFYYINLGGIKLLWGVTGTFSGTSTVNIDLPSGFFSSLQGGSITATGPYLNTNVMTANFSEDITATANPTSVGITPLVIAGSNPDNKYTVILIGN